MFILDNSISNNIVGALAQNKNGDVNNDGDINKEDIDLLEEYLKGGKKLSEEETEYYDVNKDGTVDEQDLRILYGFINRREAEDRVRDLQDLYNSLIAEQTPGHTVLGVDNSNIDSVKSELDSAKAMLALLNKSF